MAKVITTIAAEDGMDFENICSFKTENYIGLWNYVEDCYTLIEKNEIEFYPHNLSKCTNLKELDDAVFDRCDEHITDVFDHCTYTIELD